MKLLPALLVVFALGLGVSCREGWGADKPTYSQDKVEALVITRLRSGSGVGSGCHEIANQGYSFGSVYEGKGVWKVFAWDKRYDVALDKGQLNPQKTLEWASGGSIPSIRWLVYEDTRTKRNALKGGLVEPIIWSEKHC